MTIIDTATEIRPFHVDVPDEDLGDLRQRIAATRWPTKELVGDRSQGAPLPGPSLTGSWVGAPDSPGGA